MRWRPLARETFIPRPGIEMVVAYAANTRVCRIQLPAMAPSRQPGVESAQATEDFLLELVPLAMRGKRAAAVDGNLRSAVHVGGRVASALQIGPEPPSVDPALHHGWRANCG